MFIPIELSPGDDDALRIGRINRQGRFVRGVIDDVVPLRVDVDLYAVKRTDRPHLGRLKRDGLRPGRSIGVRRGNGNLQRTGGNMADFLKLLNRPRLGIIAAHGGLPGKRRSAPSRLQWNKRKRNDDRSGQNSGTQDSHSLLMVCAVV